MANLSLRMELQDNFFNTLGRYPYVVLYKDNRYWDTYEVFLEPDGSMDEDDDYEVTEILYKDKNAIVLHRKNTKEVARIEDLVEMTAVVRKLYSERKYPLGEFMAEHEVNKSED